MFDLEMLARVTFYIITPVFFFTAPLLLLILRKIERKYDLWCFLSGYYVSGMFIFLALYSLLVLNNFDLMATSISSLVIALLTLALVWVELSKRPELRLLDFVPIIYDKQFCIVYKADFANKLTKPSRFLKIREANSDSPTFEQRLGFAVDLSNIGYEEVAVHEYVVHYDGTRDLVVPLLLSQQTERLKLVTQQRYTINIQPLYKAAASGFHSVRVDVVATTMKCRKEIWFDISEDFTVLRYVEMPPLKRLLSPFIVKMLKDP